MQCIKNANARSVQALLKESSYQHVHKKNTKILFTALLTILKDEENSDENAQIKPKRLKLLWPITRLETKML